MTTLSIKGLAWCSHAKSLKSKHHRRSFGFDLCKCTTSNKNHKHNNHKGPPRFRRFFKQSVLLYVMLHATVLGKRARYTNKWKSLSRTKTWPWWLNDNLLQLISTCSNSIFLKLSGILKTSIGYSPLACMCNLSRYTSWNDDTCCLLEELDLFIFEVRFRVIHLNSSQYFHPRIWCLDE